jgi:hypothetical protein
MGYNIMNSQKPPTAMIPKMVTVCNVTQGIVGHVQPVQVGHGNRFWGNYYHIVRIRYILVIVIGVQVHIPFVKEAELMDTVLEIGRIGQFPKMNQYNTGGCR